MTITLKSAKQKGRRLVYSVKELLLSTFNELQDDDILVPGGSQPGEDIILSPKARLKFPFSIECKNQESMNIWSALEQTEKNSKGHIPLLIFKRSRTKIYATLSLDDLLFIMKQFHIEETKKLF